MSDDEPLLVYAHVGDLHVTDAQRQNYRDFLAIVAQIETQCAPSLDFVFLPGDNADNGLGSQYKLVRTGLKMLSVPVQVIPGDHDMEPGSLANFHDGLNAPDLPQALRIRGHRCLFLDCCGLGGGGPDFRLGEAQIAWLDEHLRAAAKDGETAAVFMHTYPADLRGCGEPAAMSALLSQHRVAILDMGHTHYNELANDGSTIFAATRSTGQIEEGPVGFSLTTIDQGVVSWRFKLLDEPYPFVMITSPADFRLSRGAGPQRASCAVKAIVLGDEPIARVECRVDDGTWKSMDRVGRRGLWSAHIHMSDDSRGEIVVRAYSESGRPGAHAIRTVGPLRAAADPGSFGSDALSIGAWPENGISGTQLGPNRNGRKW